MDAQILRLLSLNLVCYSLLCLSSPSLPQSGSCLVLFFILFCLFFVCVSCGKEKKILVRHVDF